MKKYQILTFIFICLTFFCKAQEKTTLEKLAKSNQINHISDSFQDLKDGIFDYYQTDIDAIESKISYNNALLNNYFKEIISSYATNTGDLSFNNYFANINSTEKTLTLGKSIRLDNFYKKKEIRKWKKNNKKTFSNLNNLKKVGNLLTVYIKSNYSNGFANLYSEKTLNDDSKAFQLSSDLGVGFKYTRIYNGFVTALPKKAKYFRDNFVKGAIASKIATYEKGGLSKDLTILNYGIKDENVKKENKRKLIQQKYLEFYKEIIDAELAYAKDQKIIIKSNVSWWSLAAFIPFTTSQINYTVNNVDPKTANFRDFSYTGTLNHLRNKNKVSLFKTLSTKFTLQGSYFKTNNFIANNASTVVFQKITQDNGNSLVLDSPINIFTTQYDDFWATSVKGEIVSLAFDNFIGLSFAFEHIMGEIENTNWKFGIPISLKDKDGKRNINFELQYREINDEKVFGISVGYNFGKFVK